MRRSAVMAGSLTLVLALSACGGGSDGDNGGAGGEGVQVAEELNIGYNAQPPTMDPLLTTAHATRVFSRVIFEPLLTLDAEGEVQPVLAESYEVSDDGLTITFQLREDVVFHDGSDLEAADVVASLERWQEMSTIGPSYFEDAEIESPEEGVVTITMPDPMYVAPELLADPAQIAHVMPAEVIEGAGEDGIQEYIGTGPYEFGDWETDQYLRFDRFEDYSSPEGEPSGMAGEKTAYFEEMYFRFIADDSTRLSGLQTGEYDLGVPIPWDNIEVAENDPNVEVILGEAGVQFGIFNKEELPMSDINMRHAVVAAMETEDILLSSYGDEEFYTNDSALMPEDSPWYIPADPEFEDFHQNQDLDAAEQYLEDADYDGEEIRILVTRDYEDHYNSGVVLQQQLEQAGMNTELIVTDWPTVTERREDPSEYEITITSISNWPVVPATFHYFNPSWVGWTDNDEIFDAAAEMTGAEDEEGAVAAMEGLQEAEAAYLPVAKFGNRTQAGGLNVEFEGYEFISGVGEIFHHIRPVE